MAKSKYTRIARLYTLMSGANVFTTSKHSMPYVAGDKKVPMIHKIQFEHGIGAGDVPPPTGDFLEYMQQLTSKEETAMKRNDHETVLASHAFLLFQFTTSGGGADTERHHGDPVVYFDPPLAYPFDDIWLAAWTVGATGVNWGGAQIFYTVETMTLEDILQAREELT